MLSAAEATRRTAARLHDQGIQVGLEDIAHEVESGASAGEGIKRARQLVKDRKKMVDAALRELTATLSHLLSVLPFTEDGWSERRAEIERSLAQSPASGLAAWLAYWYEAAAGLRTQAWRWLGEVSLPSGGTLLHERAVTAQRALEHRDARACAWLLDLGGRGVDLGGLQVPGTDTQVCLRLLYARLCLAAGLTSDAQRVLSADGDWGDEAGRLALLARRARLAGEQEEAQSLFERATSIDPRDLDVTAEAIQRGRESTTDAGDPASELDTGLDAARAAVDALQSLADVDADLMPLLDVPAEIWVAVAERAARELDPDRAAGALSAGAAAAASNELLALVEDKRAELATSAEDRQRALIRAGDLRIGGPYTDRARACYEQARSVGGAGDEHDRLVAQATVRWADAIQVLTWQQPYSAKAAELESALSGLMSALPLLDVSGAESWAYLVEVVLRKQLARSVTQPRSEQLWKAVLAAGRAVALDLTAADRWRALSEVTETAALRYPCLVAARRALTGLGETADFDTATTLVGALANVGQLDLALAELDRLEPPGDPYRDSWLECARAHITMLHGRLEEATRLFDGIKIDPDWVWVWPSHISALLQDGQHARAAELSSGYFADMKVSADEVEWLLGAVVDAMVRGDTQAAISHARALKDAESFGESRPGMTLGMALLMAGDPDGLTLVGDAIRMHPAEVHDWDQVWRPFMEQLAKWRGLELPDPAGLEPVLEEARATLTAPAGPVADRLPADGIRTDYVAAGLALSRALTRLATGDESGAEELARLDAMPELAVETERIRAEFARLAEGRQLREAATLAVQAAADEADEAADRLRALLDSDAADVDDILQDVIGGTPSAGLLTALTQIGGEPGGAAVAARGLLARFVPAPPGPPDDDFIRLELPPSWFAGLDDPLNQHEFFLRYLPELRVRVDWAVPAIRVRTDDELEPDGYRISVAEEVKMAGSVDPALRYCLADGLDLLPESTRTHPGVQRHDEGWSIPPAALGGAGGLAELCTMPAIEVVTRIVGDVARSLDQARVAAAAAG